MRAGLVVVGEGPAGSALATGCAEAGLPVTLVGPAPERVWPATYGAWTDELAGIAGFERTVWARTWPDPLVGVEGAVPLSTGRSYGLLDNAVLLDVYRRRARAAGVRTIAGLVTGVRHDDAGSVVALADGTRLEAGLVVDASGHRPRLATSGAGRPPGWQVAHGIVGRIEDAPVPEGGMWFMDWRTPWRPRTGEPPSFLYAMDLGGGRTFLEETSLAARPAVPVPALEQRLERRLAAVGATVRTVEATERVVIPMGGPLPVRPQRVVAYGAAAGMIHPASGFQVAGALRRAPAVARVIATALAAADATPAAVAEAAWAAVWPDDLVRQRDLHLAGLEVLLRLDGPDVQRFFGAFFALPPAAWQAYLSGASSSHELAGIMTSLVRGLPPRLAARVAYGAVRGAGPRALARAALARSR